MHKDRYHVSLAPLYNVVPSSQFGFNVPVNPGDIVFSGECIPTILA